MSLQPTINKELQKKFFQDVIKDLEKQDIPVIVHLRFANYLHNLLFSVDILQNKLSSYLNKYNEKKLKNK